jgi:hypothetical protein
MKTVHTNNGTQRTADLNEAISHGTQTESESYDRVTPTDVYTRSSAYDDGYSVAQQANDFRINAETEEKLRQKWQNVARESDQGVFDPDANLHDRRYQDEFERVQGIRQDAEDAVHTAEINLREREEALAGVSKPAPEGNGVFWALFGIAVVVFSIGFAPTFHDVFFIDLALSDPLLSWIASTGVSMPIGGIMALLILCEFGRKIVTFNWLGLVGGILIALGFLLIRYSASDGLDSLSVGLFVYECALVLGLEGIAYLRRKARKEAQDVAEIYEKAENDLTVAVSQKERCIEEYAKSDWSVKKHIEYIEQRTNGTVYNAAIEEALVSAAVAGYRASVRANHGRKLGRKEKSDES